MLDPMLILGSTQQSVLSSYAGHEFRSHESTKANEPPDTFLRVFWCPGRRYGAFVTGDERCFPPAAGRVGSGSRISRTVARNSPIPAMWAA